MIVLKLKLNNVYIQYFSEKSISSCHKKENDGWTLDDFRQVSLCPVKSTVFKIKSILQIKIDLHPIWQHGNHHQHG